LKGVAFPGGARRQPCKSRCAREFIYLVVLIGVRLSGKARGRADDAVLDLTLLLLLSNSVQNAMTGPDTSLMGGVIAAFHAVIAEQLCDREIFLLAPAAGFVVWCRVNRVFWFTTGKAIETHNGPRTTSAWTNCSAALREHGIAQSVRRCAGRAGKWTDRSVV